MQFEAMKMAFADGHWYISDPRSMTVDISSLLSEKYAFQRKSAIGEKAASGQAGNPRCGDTVYLCTADEEGNMVSYIQSNYQCFGSGVVLPGSGIAFQDRGDQFRSGSRFSELYCTREKAIPYNYSGLFNM